jgi:hypothetical protein
VKHRSAQAQADVMMIRARAGLVRARTGLVNAARGLAKSYGERLSGCNVRNMNPEKAEGLSPELQAALEPLLNAIESLSERIVEYNERIERFDRVVQFRNPDSDLRREYYQRLSPVLTGEQFEIAIEQTEGFSFAQLRETYILGAQSAFEHGREIRIGDVIEAIELQVAGAQDLKTSVPMSGFVRHTEAQTR